MSSPELTLKLVKSDITWLAKTWEELVSRVEYPTRSFAILASFDLCMAFLRGRGFRMANATNRRGYDLLLGLLQTAVVKRIVEDDAKEVWFPTIVKLGFSSMESSTAILREHLERSS